MSKQKIDVVYPIAGGMHGRRAIGSKWDNNELRYSLRSLEKNFPNMGRVFIVGAKPGWITGVTHIPAEDTHRRNKDANLIDKVLLACANGVSDTFIRLSDDQCLLRTWLGGQAYYSGNADVGTKEGKWWRRAERTCDHLKAHGKPTHFYDTHSPQTVQRESFERVMSLVDYQTPPGMCINTLYFNSIAIPRHKMHGRKASFHSATTIEGIRKKSEGKLFFGYSEAGTNDAMKTFLQETFPTPSRFELPDYQPPPPPKKRRGTPACLTSDAVRAFLAVLPQGGTILELGSGKSTNTFCNSGRRVVTLEHAEKYLGRCPAAEYVYAPMEAGFYNQDDFLKAAGHALRNGDLRGVVVDGPPKKHGAHRSILSKYLSLFEGVPFLVDDTNRRSERRLVSRMAERGWCVGSEGSNGGKKWVIMVPTNSSK